MTTVWSSQPEVSQPHPDRIARVGGWLFEHRTLIPLPLAIPLLLVRVGETPPSVLLLACGATLVTLGELARLTGVHYIGVISRTRTDRLGPLVGAGPFSIVRNPLYLGNIALWMGFAMLARLLWMVPVVILLLGLEYHAIVRWEERLLESRLGDRYLAYAARVPRWLPRLKAVTAWRREAPYSWRQTFCSERGTLIAIAAGSVALWIKLHLTS